MGKVGDWSAKHDETPSYVAYRWIHDKTNQILEVNIEKDGQSYKYNVNAWCRNRAYHACVETDYDRKDDARQYATNTLRATDDGRLVDPTEWFDNVTSIPLWKGETEPIDLSIGGRIEIRHVP